MGDDKVLEKVVAVLTDKSTKSRHNDDRCDRINHVWTVLLLILFAILTLATQYVGKPIKCWAPAQFKDWWVEYTENVCWISNTYYIPMEETIPVAIDTREDAEIKYYQWTPIILLFLALLFKIPNLLWNTLNDYVGVDIDKLVKMAVESQWVSPKDRDKKVDNLASFIHMWVTTCRPYSNSMLFKIKLKVAQFCFCFGKRAGNYLRSLYMSIKVLYCINAVSVFFILNRLMAFEFNVFGYEILEYLIREGEMKEVPTFPRVTLCDFEIRLLQNIHRYSVQCVLPVNLFNEKIFIVLWFWFLMIAIVNFMSLFYWIKRFMFSSSGRNYVKKYLKMADVLQNRDDKNTCKKFVNEYLRPDGIFVLRILEKNSSDLVVSDIVVKLFAKFKQQGV